MTHLKLGMVGGGQGAFIGAVHRIAARIDGRKAKRHALKAPLRFDVRGALTVAFGCMSLLAA